MYLNNHVLLFYNMSGTLFNEEMFIQERIEPTYAPAQTLFFDPFVRGTGIWDKHKTKLSKSFENGLPIFETAYLLIYEKINKSIFSFNYAGIFYFAKL